MQSSTFSGMCVAQSLQIHAHPHLRLLQVTTELLFEQYTVPSAAYCLDSMMSFYQNNLLLEESQQDGLVFSFNTASTSIIPVLGRKGILSHAKR